MRSFQKADSIELYTEYYPKLCLRHPLRDKRVETSAKGRGKGEVRNLGYWEGKRVAVRSANFTICAAPVAYCVRMSLG